MKRTTYTISNITCPACVMHLEALEDELEGVLAVRASYKKQRMEVEFDESRISDRAIRLAVAKLGYQIAN